MSHSRKGIAISKLVLDSENSRHDHLTSQAEIIDWMCTNKANEKNGEKLEVLARHIAKFGLSPADAIIVTPGKNSNEYRVLEGNRRITALKLLNNPTAAPNDKLKKAFGELAKSSDNIPKTVECVIFDEPEEAFQFIELKHLGELGGAGTVRWNSVQQDRHAARRQGKPKNPRSALVLDYLRSNPKVDKSVRDLTDSSNFPITTLERVLSDTDTCRFLGIDLKKGELNFIVAESEAIKPLSKVVLDIGTKKVNVQKVFNKKLREDYVNSFDKKYRPDPTVPDKGIENNNEPDNTTVTESSNDKDVNTASIDLSSSGKKASRKTQSSVYRQTLAPASGIIPITNAKYTKHQQLYAELRNLKIDRKPGSREKIFPITASMAFRAFLELSTNAYIESKKLPCPYSTDGRWDSRHSLLNRVQTVLKELDGGSSDKKGWKGAIKKMFAKHREGSPHTIHEYMHGQTAIPSVTELKRVWDCYHHYFAYLWDEIN